MTAGRPLKFKSAEELQKKIDDYFKITPFEELTITGLALHLDTYRETLCNYEKRDEFLDTIKKAKQRIENAYEKRLIKRGGSGDIFALKNFGWRDKQEHDHTTKGEPITGINYVRNNDTTNR
jgi:hypothetical protein